MAVGPTIHDIKEITSVLSDTLKMDVSNYAFSFLRRRFSFIYQALKIKSAKAFIEDIKNGTVVEDFCYTFPVGEHEMFRDPSFWRSLRIKLIPALGENLTFWFPELITAEELFSLLVILEEEKLLGKARVLCNVSCNKRIEELKQGRISNKNIELNKKNFKRLELMSKFEDYFIEEEGCICIQQSLLQNLEFIKGNYFSNSPEQAIGLALFRNRMLYYNSKLQSDAERHLAQCLGKGAYLALGIKEQIARENEQLFGLYDSGEQIYRVS